MNIENELRGDVLWWINDSNIIQGTADKKESVPTHILNALIDLAYEHCVRTCNREQKWFWFKGDGYENGSPKNDETTWRLIISLGGNFNAVIQYDSFKPLYGQLQICDDNMRVLGSRSINFEPLYKNSEHEEKIVNLTNH